MPDTAAQKVLKHLTPYAGYADPALTLMDSVCAARMMTDLNRALQEIFGRNLRDTHGDVVRAPTQVSVDVVTSLSKDITFTGFQPWMAGCTITISGAPQNKLVQKAGNALALTMPYVGSSGTNVPAVVYHDALTLPSSIGAIYGPFTFHQETTPFSVEMVNSLKDLTPNYTGFDLRPIRRPLLGSVQMAIQAGASGTASRRIVWDSLPDVQYLFTCEAEILPTFITSWDDERAFLLMPGLDEKILLPWVLFKFADYPHFTGSYEEAAKAYTAAQADWAAQSWQGGTTQPIDVGIW